MKDTEVQPLFPDTIEPKRHKCWNCGQPGIVDVSTRYKCVCGCGWTNRYGVNEKTERATRELREKLLARQAKLELVDFTKPGALSSPA